MRLIAAVALMLSLNGCGDPSPKETDYVGSMSQVSDAALELEAVCIDGEPKRKLVTAEFAENVTVEVPVGDHNSGGGRVVEGTPADLRSPALADWQWAVHVKDGEATTVSPWFVDGCSG